MGKKGNDLYPGFSRCLGCDRRNPKGLTAGVCKKCWNEASARIRERLTFQGPRELRYNAYGHIRTAWGTRHKETRVERAETPSLNPVESVA